MEGELYAAHLDIPAASRSASDRLVDRMKIRSGLQCRDDVQLVENAVAIPVTLGCIGQLVR